MFRIQFQPGQKGLYADTWANHEEYEFIPEYKTTYKVIDSAIVNNEDGKFVGGIVDLEAIQK